MELFFRKYFWTVNLVFILLVAWLVARTVNLFVESAIAPAPSAEPAARAPAARPGGPSSWPRWTWSACRSSPACKMPEPEPVVQEPTATPWSTRTRRR